MLEIKEYTGKQRDEYIDALGIEYTATFIPFSESRNKGEKLKSLNWLVTLRKGHQEIKTDYMQGQGHVKGYKSKMGGMTMYEKEDQDTRLEKACEEGRWVTAILSTGSVFTKPHPGPLLKDVLYSLVMDSDALDYPTFEDWADCFGYDTDSRSGEKVYRACLEIALKMRAMFGDAGLEKLREVFQDY